MKRATYFAVAPLCMALGYLTNDFVEELDDSLHSTDLVLNYLPSIKDKDACLDEYVSIQREYIHVNSPYNTATYFITSLWYKSEFESLKLGEDYGCIGTQKLSKSISDSTTIDNLQNFVIKGFNDNEVAVEIDSTSIRLAELKNSYFVTDEVKKYLAERIRLSLSAQVGKTNQQIEKSSGPQLQTK